MEIIKKIEKRYKNEITEHIKKKEREKENIKEKIHNELLFYLKNLLNNIGVTLKVLVQNLYNIAIKKANMNKQGKLFPLKRSEKLGFSKTEFVRLISGFNFINYDPFIEIEFVLKTIFNLIFHNAGDNNAINYYFHTEEELKKKLSYIYNAKQLEGKNYLSIEWQRVETIHIESIENIDDQISLIDEQIAELRLKLESDLKRVRAENLKKGSQKIYYDDVKIHNEIENLKFKKKRLIESKNIVQKK